MSTLEVWYSPAAACYRVEDGEMFTYYRLDQVIGHFTNRARPAVALVATHWPRAAAIIAALTSAGITVEQRTQE